MIGSKFGLYLRELIREKRKNPEYKLEYIPGTATAKRTRKTKAWEHRNMPRVYVPAHVRATRDLSEFYEKAPLEMSRYELQQLEQVLRGGNEEKEAEEAQLDANGNVIDPEVAYKQGDEFLNYQQQMRQLHPTRIGIFKRYWSQCKYNKRKRELLVSAFDAADEQAAYYYGEGFKGWRDEIEGVHEFFEELKTKKSEAEASQAQSGNTIVKT